MGIGTILETPVGSHWQIKDRVIFFAPNHSLGQDCICVDERFVVVIPDLLPQPNNPQDEDSLPEVMVRYVGWSVFSGVPVEHAALQTALVKCAALAGLFSQDSNIVSSCGQRKKPRERIEATAVRTQKPSAVLFGLGNYAKTQIIPYAQRSLDLRCVHEVDPDQMVVLAGRGMALDTSPQPRPGEHYDAWFIAGFHHTHAPLAVHALGGGACAVVEKPLATTWDQFREVQSALDKSDKEHLFVCFQKRYSRLNEWARSDLGVSAGEPVDMHCIVYEIPLPRLHWYNWPNSGSRITSNGCHWLDYFLYMNDYCKVSDAGLWCSRGSDLALFVCLQNGAKLLMSITDIGSERLGMRDLIELRAGLVTVRMTDSMYYEAESSARFIRRTRVNPMDAYRRMYRKICESIVQGSPGDSRDSLRSTELMLYFEDEMSGPKKRGNNKGRFQ